MHEGVQRMTGYLLMSSRLRMMLLLLLRCVAIVSMTVASLGMGQEPTSNPY